MIDRRRWRGRSVGRQIDEKRREEDEGDVGPEQVS
jgi:hypothetical protein